MKINVIAHPNAKKPRIEEDLLGTLHIYVNQPPLEGKANKAIVESLSIYYKVKRNSVILISGERSRNKFFEILEK